MFTVSPSDALLISSWMYNLRRGLGGPDEAGA